MLIKQEGNSLAVKRVSTTLLALGARLIARRHGNKVDLSVSVDDEIYNNGSLVRYTEELLLGQFVDNGAALSEQIFQYLPQIERGIDSMRIDRMHTKGEVLQMHKAPNHY